MIAHNILQVKQKIEKAHAKSKQTKSGPTLIAVSKTKPIHMLQEAYEAGCRDFGENKVQELVEKYEVMPKDIKWHMIGHLQRNKVKYIVDKVALIHSVDSLKLAQEISTQAIKKDVVVSVLVEVNVAGEETKFGVAPEETEALIRDMSLLKGIKVCGLMTIAPYVENAEDNRQYFAQLKQLFIDINEKNIDNIYMNVLSMGMTGDYEVATEEGATYVRVGTGIFGDRQYTL